jgi:hypothetical protein
MRGHRLAVEPPSAADQQRSQQSPEPARVTVAVAVPLSARSLDRSSKTSGLRGGEAFLVLEPWQRWIDEH